MIHFSYVINFQSGTKTTNESRYQGGDIPFHISFRLHSPTEVCHLAGKEIPIWKFA